MNYIDLFSKSVGEHATQIALVQDDRKISYKDLDTLSSQIAAKLKAKGANRGSFIAVSLPRSIEFVASYLGIFKAGMVVVPLSQKYPQERINFILGHCEAFLCIDESFFADITDYGTYLDVGGDDEPALLIYTSGSTGKPKGILHTNKSLAYMVSNTISCRREIENKSYASLCEFSFAVFVDDYLAALCLGCEIHIVNNELRLSAELLQTYFKNNKIYAALLPHAVLSLFDKAPKLKVLYTGSERLSSLYFKEMTIKNIYGMSETGGQVASFLLDKKYQNTPIGKGGGDIELLVLDENGKEVKTGECGEIVIKGDFSQRYFKDPEKSAKTFVKSGSKTLIFTNDIGFKDKESNITLIGRKDWMVKIHGQRVQIYEIESALKSMKGMKECAVKAFCDEHGQNYLVAFVACDKSAEILRDELAKSLVDYMIPRYFVFMDVLPKNINGKIDRKALKEPEKNEVVSKKEFIEPKSKEECELCAVFASVLEVDKVGLNDDFSELGGDSLSAASIAACSKLKGISPSLIFKEKKPQNILKACAKLKSLDNDQTSAKLTHLQKYMCSIDKTANKTDFRTPFYLKLPQNVDIECFKNALNKAFLTHKIFNARIEKSSLVYKKEELVLDFQKIENLDNFFSSFLARSFDLDRDRLYRFCLCECEGRCYLVCDVHHIIFDGTSLGIFARDIAYFYNNPNTEIEHELLAFSRNYAKIIKNRQKTPFDHKIVNINSAPKGDITSPEQIGSEYLIERTIENTDRILEFTAMHKITPDSLFVSAFALGVLRASGTKECEISYALVGRHHKDLEHSVGLYAELFPVHFEMGGLKELCAIKDLYAQHSSFLATLMSNNVKVGYVYEDNFFDDIDFGNDKMELGLIKTEFKGVSLYLTAMKKQGAFHFILRYNRNLYTKGFIEKFWELYASILDGFLCGKEQL